MIAKDPTQGHFHTLRLHCDASDVEIKDAYFRLAREHHPDHNYGDPDAADRFKEVQLAYESLSKRFAIQKPNESEQFPFITPDPPKHSGLKLCAMGCVALFVLTAITWGLFRGESRLIANQVPKPVAAVLPPNISSDSSADHSVTTQSSLNIAPWQSISNIDREAVTDSELGGSFNDPAGAQEVPFEDLQDSYSTVQPEPRPISSSEERAVHNLPESSDSVGTLDGPSTSEQSTWSSNNSVGWPIDTDADYYSQANIDSISLDSSVSRASWESKPERLNHLPSELNYRFNDNLDRIPRSQAKQVPLENSLSTYSQVDDYTQSYPSDSTWPRAHVASKPMPALTNSGSIDFGSTISRHVPSASPAYIQPDVTNHNRSRGFPSSLDRPGHVHQEQRKPIKHWSSWNAKPGLSRGQGGNFRQQQPEPVWPLVDGRNFDAIHRAEKRNSAMHSKSLMEGIGSEYWNPVQAVPQKTSLDPGSKKKAPNWKLSDSLANERSRTGWKGQARTESRGHKFQDWSPEPRRIEVHKNKLEPYASKAGRTPSRKGGYHSGYATSGPGSTRASTPATSKLHLPGTNYWLLP